ncbi:hypothetical protein ABZ769_23740 [Streptomyces olivoreticuli]
MSEVSAELLAVPSVDGSVKGTVTVNGGSPRLVVRVEPYAGMSEGDEVQLRWDTGIMRTSRIESRVIGAAAVGTSTLFAIPQSPPCAARVSYLIGHASGEWSVSRPLAVMVRA